jgi:capsule polysaccharide modification protein KpsS
MENNFAKWEVCSQYDGLILKNIECDKNILEVVTFEKVLNSDFLEIADWDTVEVNTVVKVRMNWGDTRWRIRHFAKYEDGYVKVWANGRTSYTAQDKFDTEDWDEVVLFNEEEIK